MASKSAYECKGCCRHFDDSCKHLTGSKKCLKKYSPDELLKIYEDQLQILNKKICCESCNISYNDTCILKHLSSKKLCKEYYRKREKRGLLKEDVTKRRNSKRRLVYAIDKLTPNSQGQNNTRPFVINITDVAGQASTSHQSTTTKRPQNVLPIQASSTTIFVKDDGEEYFTPLHLDQTDIIGLKEAIQAKYDKYQSQEIGSLFLIKKGNRVILEDRMVNRFRDETFLWMKTHPMDMINSITITLSEEMFPSKPSQTSVPPQENEVSASPSTSETITRDSTRESRPNGTTSASLVQASNSSDRPEDGLFTVNLTPQQQTVNGLNLTPQQQVMDLDELLKSCLDQDPHFRYRLSVTLDLLQFLERVIKNTKHGAK